MQRFWLRMAIWCAFGLKRSLHCLILLGKKESQRPSRRKEVPSHGSSQNAIHPMEDRVAWRNASVTRDKYIVKVEGKPYNEECQLEDL